MAGTETGTRALTFRISNVDGEDIDLAAWSPRFGELATWYGRGFALGQDQIDNPAAYFDVGALRIHRTPLDWLKANRDGICIIQPNLTYATLRSVLERSFYLWHERYRLRQNQWLAQARQCQSSTGPISYRLSLRREGGSLI